MVMLSLSGYVEVNVENLGLGKLTTPSSFNNTPNHDRMHLLLGKQSTIKYCIVHFHNTPELELEPKHHIKYNEIEIISVQREEPLYNQNKYLIGSCDILVYYKISDYNGVILFELKPELLSVGGVVSQTKIYAKYIPEMVGKPDSCYDGVKPHVVILTEDKNQRNIFGDILNQEGIGVYFIEENGNGGITLQ
jgi:hypothetical protein